MDDPSLLAGRTPPPDASTPAAAKMLAYLSVVEELRCNEENKLALLLQVNDLKETLSMQKHDQRDIYFYLNKKCDDSYNIVAQLEEQISMEQQDRENCERALEQRIAELENKICSDEERSRVKIGVLEDKLTGLEKFHDTQILLERQIQEYKETIERERRENAARLDDLELQQTVVRDTMRKEKDQALADLRVEMNQSLESRMPAAMQKTLLINSLIKRELQQQSVTAMDLLDRDQQIQQYAKDMKLELTLAQDKEKELIDRISIHQRTIKSLRDQISRDAELREQTKRDFIAKVHQRDAEISMLRHQLRSLEQRLANATNAQPMREVWEFLSEAYEAHSGPRHNNAKDNKIQQYPFPPEWANQQERLLTFLIRSLLLRYPSKFQHFLGMSSKISFRGEGLPALLTTPPGPSLVDDKDRYSESVPQLSRPMGSRDGGMVSAESMQAFRNIFLPPAMQESANMLTHSIISVQLKSSRGGSSASTTGSLTGPPSPSWGKSPHPSLGRPSHRLFKTSIDSQSVVSTASQSSYSSRHTVGSSAGKAAQIQAVPGGSFGTRGPRQVTQLNMRELISDKILKATSDQGFDDLFIGMKREKEKRAKGNRAKNAALQLQHSSHLEDAGGYEGMMSPASSVSMSPRFVDGHNDSTASINDVCDNLVDELDSYDSLVELGYDS